MRYYYCETTAPDPLFDDEEIGEIEETELDPQDVDNAEVEGDDFES